MTEPDGETAEVEPKPPSPPPAAKRRRVKAESTPTTAPVDQKAEKEAGRFAWFKEEKNARIVSLYEDIVLRFVMAGLFFWLTHSWLNTVTGLLDRQNSVEKPLSDGVLIALLTSTTVNVLSLLIAVSLYLFPKRKFEEKIEAAVKAGTADEQ